MSTLIKWILIVAGIGIAVAAWYFLWYLPSQTPDDSGTTGPADGTPCTVRTARSRPGTYQGGICVPLPANRMTAIQANAIVNQYAVKDSAGYPTINFIGDFTKPNLASFPTPSLQNLLQNGWWLALLTGGTLNGYQAGDNGNYLVAIYDLRDTSAAINNGKSQIAIPAPLQPYITL